MKRTKFMKAFFPLAALSLFAFAGCDTPTTSSGDISYVIDSSATNKTPSADTSKNTDTEEQRNNSGSSSGSSTTSNNSVSVSLPDDYVRGFDASYVYDIEAAGKKYYETDGSETDFFNILKNHGVNTVRLRTWVDPENAETNGIVSNDSSWASSGLNTTEKTVALAKRAKVAGLKVVVDFHYSDYWADPAKQIIPYEWQSCATADEIAEKLSEYTKKVLQALKDEDATPDYVQVGNEIDSGMLMHKSYNGSNMTDADEAIKGTLGTDSFNKYLAAGCKAVRDFDSRIKIIIHITNRKPAILMKTISSATTDYDIIGLSYYPWESSHGTISELRSNVTNLKSTYGKDVMVVESSMYWNYGVWDSNYRDLSQAAKHLIDPDTNAIYSDMTTETVTYNGSDTTIIKGSVNNQMASFRHIIEESADCGSTGIFAWGGDMQGEWKYAFFDDGGKAMESIEVFNVKSSSSSAGSGEESKTLLNAGSFTVSAAETYTQVLESSKFSGLTITSLKVNVSSDDGSWCSLSGAGNYAAATYLENAINTTTSITSSDFIDAVKTNGLYIHTSDGTFKVSVEYD